MRILIALGLALAGCSAASPETASDPRDEVLFNTIRRVDHMEAEIARMKEANRAVDAVLTKAVAARVDNRADQQTARSALVEHVKDGETDRRLSDLERSR